jgi:hypothetical protein
MSDRISRHLRANAVGYLALFVALSGTAVASGALSKKKVNKIITNRAPGLSVAKAANAQNAGNSENLGGLPPSAFAGAPKRLSFERTSGGTADAGMFGPYDVTVECNPGGGAGSPTSVIVRAIGPAGTLDAWGADGSGGGAANADLFHATGTTLAIASIGVASGGSIEQGMTGLIATGTTLISYQLAAAVKSGPFDCTVRGAFEVSS